MSNISTHIKKRTSSNSIMFRPGTLDDSFNRLGDYYDIEVKRMVESMISAIEPMTIILLGGIFGLIALSIL